MRWKSWDIFTKDFSENILPIYEKHEKTFDQYQIHSRLHIARSLIFSEFMSRFYYKRLKINDVDFTAIRYAVAFHDSGRQQNGVDLWENDSSKLCFSYLRKDYDIEFSEFASSLIIKKKMIWDINEKIVTDADVLEIMRPVCGHGGANGFDPKYLHFLNDNLNFKKIRKNLIDDAWKLIEYTENNKQLFTDNNHLYKMLEIINTGDYSVLKII